MNYDFEHGKKWVVKKNHPSIGMFMPDLNFKPKEGIGGMLDLLRSHNRTEKEGYVPKAGDTHVMVRSDVDETKYHISESFFDARFRMCNITEEEIRDWYIPFDKRYIPFSEREK